MTDTLVRGGRVGYLGISSALILAATGTVNKDRGAKSMNIKESCYHSRSQTYSHPVYFVKRYPMHVSAGQKSVLYIHMYILSTIRLMIV